MNIVFEGIDGVGKTTVIDLMKKDLESNQKEILKGDYANYMDFYRPFKEIVLFNLKPIDLLVYIHAPLETSVSRVAQKDNVKFKESQKLFLQSLKDSLEKELISK